MHRRRTCVLLPLLVLACSPLGGSSGSGDDADASSGSSADETGVPSDGCPALDGANGSGTDWESLDGVTLTAAGSPHRIEGIYFLVDTTLEVEPCAVVLLGYQSSIGTAGEGRIVARGTADAPIVFDAIDPEMPWTGLSTGMDFEIYGGFLDLEHVTLRNGGGDDFFPGTLFLSEFQTGLDAPVDRARVRHVVIEDSLTGGVTTQYGAVFSADSEDLTIVGAGSWPIIADYWMASRIPSGSYTGNAHDEIMLDYHFFRAQPELYLPARGVPYRLGGADDFEPFSLEIYTTEADEPVTLRLDPGVELRFSPGTMLDVFGGGVLDARGTAEAPIVFTSATESPSAGDWLGVFLRGAGAATVLDHVEIAYAGEESGSVSLDWEHCPATDVEDTTEAAAITLTEEPPAPFITNTTIRDSAAHGINRAWQGEAIDLLPSNTLAAIAGCSQTMPASTLGECPDAVSCAQG